jgi:hypothetical protein
MKILLDRILLKGFGYADDQIGVATITQISRSEACKYQVTNMFVRRLIIASFAYD